MIAGLLLPGAAFALTLLGVAGLAAVAAICSVSKPHTGHLVAGLVATAWAVACFFGAFLLLLYRFRGGV